MISFYLTRKLLEHCQMYGGHFIARYDEDGNMRYTKPQGWRQGRGARKGAA